jgi:hypothetical protein
MSVICEVENRGKRSYLVGINDVVSGGRLIKGVDGKPASMAIDPDKTAKVTESCCNALSKFKDEIKIIKKTNRKE